MRSGALAALLAFLCPGLGHYYAGLPRRAARVVLIQFAAFLLAVLVFGFPPDPSIDYIKRCAGVPGDTLLFRDRVLHRNGVVVEEPYAQYQGASRGRAELDSFGPIVVPEGQLLMLGDNRDWSSDSRVWGFLDMELVHGRADHIYWSWDGGGKSVRWGRIGEKIR